MSKTYREPANRAARLGAPIVLLSIGLAGCSARGPEQAPTQTEASLPSLPAWLVTREGQKGGPPLTVADREHVVKILRIQGFDVSATRFFADDWLVVEGDIIFDARSVLRDGATEREKGYWWNPAVAVSNYRDIHVVGDPNYPPNATWTWAIVAGGSDWNAKTHVVFTTVAPPPGATILWVQAGSFGPGYECYVSLTSVPAGGKPGIIAFNTGYNCTDPHGFAQCRTTLDGLSWDEKVHFATHEMGHALGFWHPADSSQGGGTLIAGTHSAPDPNTPNYPSVMWGGWNSCYTGSANVTLQLSADDVASANARYH